MLDIIRKASLGAVSNTNPMAALYGTVLSISPLEVSVEQRFSLPASVLVIPETITKLTKEINGETKLGLQPGDRVLLLRIQGGQSYVVLDRVVDSI